MLVNRVTKAASGARVTPVRFIGTTARLYNKSLPSTPEMKSNESWAGNESSNNNSVISRVVGMARSLQENTQPPINIAKPFTKKFNLSETYDPFDFSNDKMDIEKRERRQTIPYEKMMDPFEKAGIDPLDIYTMPEILSRFLSSTGQILPREITGCNAKNQKKLSNAIKRARTCGLLSTVHKHSRYLPTRNM
ncbi:uncharacterized protein AC631_01225 [Debaryomyces fabryi]|uniref:Small ribosomal subunit protein bS18m n=1 Tax=Debaryomyces fabryi TaxID=58627 RepID=A0A0V1Q3Q1_9ASCO|nr:uncharacterized protein AC631_01225 [Debaryomyces fabryi]KSA02970.1 hypothetical protein AC631_01225 [Debaryomyces fabryi]CUM47471.1 unnamed protein product [Debaryomyces fabryi]